MPTNHASQYKSDEDLFQFDTCLATACSLASEKQHKSFLQNCLQIIIDKLFDTSQRSSKVVEYHDPEKLKALFDFKLQQEPQSHFKLYEILNKIFQYSVKIGHPYFLNQLFSSVDPYGLVGQWVSDSLNPSVYTYEVAPLFTLMEEEVLFEMRKIVGFDEGNGDGIFCPGGSISNGYGISCARFYVNPNIKENGLHGLPRMVLFASEDAHYSVQKMASFMGLGTNGVILIETNNQGQMSVEDLEDKIVSSLRCNMLPFLVVATAGTTVLGAFDPILDIANICAKYNLWLHVDAAWGGGALMSNRYKSLLVGIERADSITWNPHKLLTVPQQCSVFLTKHKDILKLCHEANALYLFQKDKFYDTKYDTGDKHIQCGRRADVLKFWFMWKAKGFKGFEEHVNRNFENAEYFLKSIQRRHDFKLVLEHPEYLNICFWYIPKSLQSHPTDENFALKLNSVAPKIKEKMVKEGSMMVTYQPIRKLPNFFRIVFQNSGLEQIDMIHLITEFQRLAYDL